MAVLGVWAMLGQPDFPAVGRTKVDRVVTVGELYSSTWSQPNATWSQIWLVADSVSRIRHLQPALAVLPAKSREHRWWVSGPLVGSRIQIPAMIVRDPVTASTLTPDSTDPSRFRVSVSMRRAIPIGDVVAAIAVHPHPGNTSVGLGLRLAVADDGGDALGWVTGAGSATRVLPSVPGHAEDRRPNEPPRFDLVVCGSGEEAERWRARAAEPATATERRGSREPTVLSVRSPRPSWAELMASPRQDVERFVRRARSDDVLPPVDSDVLSPMGFLVEVGDEVAQLVDRRHSGVAGYVLVGRGQSSHFDATAGVTPSVVEFCRSHRAVVDDPSAHAGPVHHAQFLTQAACAALPLVSPELPITVRALIGEDLTAALTGVSVAQLADPLVREYHALQLHRIAFAQHRARARWSTLAQLHGRRAGTATPSVSVTVATMRPDLLPRIAEQVGGQDWADVELVVGLHGFETDHPKVAELRRGYPGPLSVVSLPRQMIFGDVLNELTDRVSGELVAKMDDDDWYSRHHLTDLVAAEEFSGADLITAGAEFVYLQPLDLTIRRGSIGGGRFTTAVSGPGLLMRTTRLREIGGWRPVHRAVDTGLARSVLGAGGSVYRSHGLGFVLTRTSSGHTWDPGMEYFVRSAQQQWPGFRPPPGILGKAPAVGSPPRSYFEPRNVDGELDVVSG